MGLVEHDVVSGIGNFKKRCLRVQPAHEGIGLAPRHVFEIMAVRPEHNGQRAGKAGKNIRQVGANHKARIYRRVELPCPTPVICFPQGMRGNMVENKLIAARLFWHQPEAVNGGLARFVNACWAGSFNIGIPFGMAFGRMHRKITNHQPGQFVSMTRGGQQGNKAAKAVRDEPRHARNRPRVSSPSRHRP